MISRLCNDLKEYEGNGEGEARGGERVGEVTGCSPCSGAKLFNQRFLIPN